MNVIVQEEATQIQILGDDTAVVQVQAGLQGPQGIPGPQGEPGPDEASLISFEAYATITETNVQDAIEQLQSQVQARIPTVKSSIYLEDNNIPTNIETQNVGVKVAGNFQAGPTCGACTYNGNRITYNGSNQTRICVLASADITSSPNNTFLLEIRKNGQVIAGSRCKIRIGTSIGGGTLNAFVDVNNGDYLELWITNTTSNADATVIDTTMVLMN